MDAKVFTAGGEGREFRGADKLDGVEGSPYICVIDVDLVVFNDQKNAFRIAKTDILGTDPDVNSALGLHSLIHYYKDRSD